MAYDKVVDSAVLDAGLKAIADAIREKGGTSDNLDFYEPMVEAIKAIEAGGVQLATGTFTAVEDVIVSSNYLFEHNAGFEPKLFVLYDPNPDTTKSSLQFVLKIKDTTNYTSESAGYGLMAGATYSSSAYHYAKTFAFNKASTYFSTVNHNGQYAMFSSYSGGKMLAGHSYAWVAFSDWEAVG